MNRINTALSTLLRVNSDRALLIALSTMSTLLSILAYVLLVAPNATYVEIFLNDVMGLTDAAYRTYRGQIPSIDFLSLYGAAIYYPAALAFHLNFDAGGVLGFGHLITAVPLLTLAALTSYRRFPFLPSIIFILFLFLLIVVPMRPGGDYTDLTYGIFYTRHGWAALAIVLVFYLEPRSIDRKNLIVDAILLSLLLIYLFYLKVTFAAVGLAFVAANSVTSRYKMWLSALSLSIFVFFVAALSVLTGYNSAYFNGILGTISRNPVIQSELLFHRHQWIFFTAFAALSAVYMTGHRRFFDLVFMAGCFITSLWLLDQSGGTHRGLPAMITVFLIFGELARRRECLVEDIGGSSWQRAHVASLLILSMLLVFVSEPMKQGVRALNLHFYKVKRETAVATLNQSGIFVDLPPVDSIHERLGHDESAHTQYNQQRALEGWPELQAWEYLPIIAEGVKLLESVPHENHSVIAFEQSNPFSVLLSMRPTAYGYPLFWADHSPAENLPAPERYFSGADYVMVPETAYSLLQLKKLMQVYGSYLEKNYYVLKRSPHWRLYARL